MNLRKDHLHDVYPLLKPELYCEHTHLGAELKGSESARSNSSGFLPIVNLFHNFSGILNAISLEINLYHNF